MESKIINERILDYLKDKDYKKIEIEISPKIYIKNYIQIKNNYLTTH